MFPYNQPDKTKDCGYRCLYYSLRRCNAIEKIGYDEWLNNFRFFNPIKSGITFTDIHTIFDYYKVDYTFTHLTDQGLYIIYSGIWLHQEGKKHGHYFIYESGQVLCSTHTEPYNISLENALKRLESKTIEHSYRCMKINGKIVEK
jgi:hypothetical protein